MPSTVRAVTLLGRLADHQRENEFQLSHFSVTRRRMQFLCGLTAVAYLGAVYADTFQVSGNDLATMISARVSVFCLGMFSFFYSFKKDITPTALGLVIGLYMGSVIASECIELVLKEGHDLLGTPIPLFIVLLYYLYLPPQIWQSLIAGGLGSIAYLVTLATMTNAPPDYIANTSLLFMIANGFGLYFCTRFRSAQRREFLAVAELRKHAEIDPLTGIYNRRRILELGEQKLKAALRYGHLFSILLIDVDYFKVINDTYGHAAGDKALVTLANHFAQKLRDADLFGRLGGEEFVIIMPYCDKKQAILAAERLRQGVESIPFVFEDDSFSLTVSIGVAKTTKDTATLDKLIQRADAALYMAKKDGRNTVCCQDQAQSKIPL